MITWRRALVVALLAGLAGAVAWFAVAGPAASTKPGRPETEEVGRVGRWVITADALLLRRRQIDMSYPGAGVPEAALAQLVHGYLAAEVLRAQGVDLDRSTWQAERDRIERQTRDRDRLERIKAIYHDDPEAYLTVGILPDFALSRVQRTFHATPRFAESARVAASTFVDGVAGDPATFAARARERGIAVTSLVATATGDESSVRLHGLLVGLADGQVHPNTLETPEAFHAVRVIRHRPDGAVEVEMAAFPKPTFDDWFWTEARRFPVLIHDAALRAAFRQRVTWADRLDLAPGR